MLRDLKLKTVNPSKPNNSINNANSKYRGWSTKTCCFTKSVTRGKKSLPKKPDINSSKKENKTSGTINIESDTHNQIF